MTKSPRPTINSNRASILEILLALVLFAAALPAASQAAPSQLWEKCKQGTGAGQCSLPRGIAVDPDSGNLYVANGGNLRINELTAWGEFVKAWGWGVVQSGPGNKPQNERQELSVDATAGSFSLSYEAPFRVTAPIPFDASAAVVQSALQGLNPPIEAFVSGPDGGPWTIDYTGAQADTDIEVGVTNSTLSGGAATATVKAIQQGANFEVCVPADGDVCRAGQAGASPGQFSSPQGMAVDSNGDIYVGDLLNRRVQKFDAEGHFLLTFGGGVNQGPSHPGNVCTSAHVAEGDICGRGTIGAASGQFDWGFPLGAGFVSIQGSYIAITPDDKVFVGDKERIQQFNTSGVYMSQIALPAGERVQSLAVDPSGNFYVSFFDSDFFLLCCSKEGVHKLSPAGATLPAGELAQLQNPRAIATDATGHVYVVDNSDRKALKGVIEAEVLEFDSSGKRVGSGSARDGLNESTGIATSSACGIPGVDIYVSHTNSSKSFVRAYGPPPDPDVCPPPAIPPTIIDTYTLSAASDGAMVRSRIGPNFWPDTRYYVQYGTGKCSEGGCTEEQPTAPGSQLTTKVTDAEIDTAGVFLTGLSPDTTYRYRFVVESSGGGPVFGPEETFHTLPPPQEPNTGCPNQAFRVGLSAKLPDCRAYEMVSPVDKNNGDVATATASFDQASIDGQRMTFSSLTSFADPETAPLVSQYLASRDSAKGWSTHSISPPRDTIHLYPTGGSVNNIQFKAFTQDLCDGWLVQDVDVALTPGAPPGVPNLYRRENCGEPSYELLTTTPPPGFEFEFNDSQYYALPQGFSADGSRSVFVADAALTPNANPQKEIFQLYVAYDGGKLRLVSVLPNGSAATTHSTAGTSYSIYEFREDSIYHAVSADGSRIFWTASDNTNPASAGGHPNNPGSLYLRLNPAEPQSLISEGKCSQPTRACTIVVSEAPARFEGADPDGTKALYSVGENLFEFEVATATSNQIAGGVKGLMGASEDLSRVYFVSTQVLSGEQENGEGDKAQAGKPNIYLYEAEGDAFTFVATIDDKDANNTEISSAPLSPIARMANHRISRVTPDGLHAAFVSLAPLSGYDNTDANSGQPDAEIFHYDAITEELHCVSCNPTGARPSGREYRSGVNGGVGSWAAALLPGWESSLHPSRVLSGDGDRLFYDSFDALVMGDTNGRKDVYQWEAPGSGDCTTESSSYFDENGGCISLISTGQSASDSEFFDATPSGSDVFFATQSSLLPQDPGLVDIYVAKVEGGFPPPPVSPPPCVGDACQSVPALPTDPTPASANFRGAGNLPPARSGRCAKGKRRVVRAGKARCVAKKQRRRSHKRRDNRSNGRAAR